MAMTALQILQAGRHFTWGTVQKIHEIGPYGIVEYLRPSGERSFHGYVNGEDTCHGAPSLDAALADAIAYRNEGLNSQAARYFMLMIGAKP